MRRLMMLNPMRSEFQESIFLPPPEEKDLQRARYALQFYREVVSLHPEGDEAQKARDGIQRVRKLLGKHELYVANSILSGTSSKQPLIERMGSARQHTRDSDLTRKHLEFQRKVNALGNKAKLLYEEFLSRFPSSNDADEMGENLAKLSNSSHD